MSYHNTHAIKITKRYEIYKMVMVTDGIEPATNGLLDQRSTD